MSSLPTLDAYRVFYQQENDRGITYPHMAGAEPALVQDRLRVISEVFSQGLVYTNCTILNQPHHRQYHTDFSYDDSECCITNTDCSQCRHYVSSYSILMDQMRQHTKTKASFIQWLDVFDSWLAMHFTNYQQTPLLLD